MTAPRWTNALAGVLAVVLAFDVAYLYGVKFADVFHSDTAGNLLIAAHCAADRSLVTTKWFYSNGDVWIVMPHVFALVPVALGGLGAGTLIVSFVLGLLTNALALGWSYARLAGGRATALAAAAITLIAWSRLHVMFVYVEIAYAMLATIYLALFVIAARIVDGRARRVETVVAAALFAATSAQNPVRAVVFVVAPVVVACLWPWRDQPWRRRLSVAGAMAVISGVALAVYELAFKRWLTFSSPSGHVDFHVRDVDGVVENLSLIARGFGIASGGATGIDLAAAPGLIVLGGALALTAAHAFGARALTASRFVVVAVLAQLAATLGPMAIGNLVLNPQSIRYALPSLMLVLGLAAILAIDRIERGRAPAARAWLATAAAVALLSLTRVVGRYTLEAPNGQWAHRAAHHHLADALRGRGLRHGFATYWNANLVTVLSHGAAKTCPVNFGARVIPYRWGTDVPCFDGAALPDRVYVALAPGDATTAAEAVRRTLGEAVERFRVDDHFDVSVFDATRIPRGWLEPPLADGARARFPMHVRSVHAALSPGQAEEREGALVATGEEGAIVFGPYIELPRGSYRVRWRGAALGPEGELGFDVIAADGAPTLAQWSSPVADLSSPGPGDLASLKVTLSASTPKIETRVFSRGGARVRLDELVIERLEP